MVSRREVTAYLTELFEIEKYHDRSLNGLQVAGADEVTGFCLGVDACNDLFDEAVNNKLNYIVVHHGFFWGAPFPVTRLWGNRYRKLLNNDLSLFAVHLPMDANPEIGHNILIAKDLDIRNLVPFGLYKGIVLGFCGQFKEPLPLDTVKQMLVDRFGDGTHMLPFGPDTISRVGVVSGGAATMDILEEACRMGLDLFITGETDHTAYHLAKEMGLNVAFCGHYSTERISLMTLAELLEEKFDLPATFFTLPTGM